MLISFDYSITAPCMCISSSANWIDAKFWFLTDKKKNEGTFNHGKFTGSLHSNWKTPEQRYDQISNYFLNVVNNNARTADVIFEDYSMGSKGRVFHIAENAEIMKWKLWKTEHKIELVPPTVLKKMATGRGNADKLLIYDTFFKETGADLSVFGKPGTNPSSDIIDSFYLIKYGFAIKEQN